MGNKTNPAVIAKEAAALEALVGDMNMAELGRSLNPTATRSMVSQHIKGRRPISLKYAKAYAAYFRVPLAAISERHAFEVAGASNVLSVPPAHDMKLLTELCDLVGQISEEGLIEIIGMARYLSTKHQAEKKRKAV